VRRIQQEEDIYAEGVQGSARSKHFMNLSGSNPQIEYPMCCPNRIVLDFTTSTPLRAAPFNPVEASSITNTPSSDPPGFCAENPYTLA